VPSSVETATSTPYRYTLTAAKQPSSAPWKHMIHRPVTWQHNEDWGLMRVDAREGDRAGRSTPTPLKARQAKHTWQQTAGKQGLMGGEVRIHVGLWKAAVCARPPCTRGWSLS
jgi:hypothetical protein